MRSIVYLNGNYLPAEHAFTHVEDRGNILGDGIYKVIKITNGIPIYLEDHLAHMENSLGKARINFDKKFLKIRVKNILQELLERNNATSCYKLYLQITRGVAPRNHCFEDDMQHTLFMILYPDEAFQPKKKKLTCILERDIRWLRKDIKSISLIANILLKQKAKDAGADEVILYKSNNIITEGGASNIFIVDREDNLITHPADYDILHGVTRQNVIKLAKKNNLKVIEREFTIEELFAAKEVFATTSGFFIAQILKIDDKLINNGKIGSITNILEEKIAEYLSEQIENASTKTKSFTI